MTEQLPDLRPDSRRARVEPDGTRRYAGSGTRYKPVPEERRKYRRNKPDDPRAVRWHGEWFLPMQLLDEAERTMPTTRPDEQVVDHMLAGHVGCNCTVCSRPEEVIGYWRRRGLRKLGLLA